MSINYPLTIKIIKEEKVKEAPFIAYIPEFDVSSCGKSEEEAVSNVKEMVDILFEEAKADGNLPALLDELGLAQKGNKGYTFPRIIIDSYSLSL